MKKIIFILLLSMVIHISSGQQCQCYQLLNANDCSMNSKCQWSGAEGCIIKIEQPVKVQDDYCFQFANTECSGNQRCALQQNQCVKFSGCQSYIGTTDAQCKEISSQCTTDGTICSNKQPCVNYTQQLCLTNASSSGSGKCRWNTSLLKCQDQTCDDGTFTTDADCNKFISGCLTNGIKCVSVKLFCQQYRGTQNTCPQYQGKDGNCKGSKPSTIEACQLKKCEDAPTTLNTDQLCSNFQLGCKTTGRGCAMTLPLCSQQVGTLKTCLDLIGRDGKCKGVSNLSYATCTLQDCQDAPSYLKTDQDCSNYIFGCVTNGKGCTRQLQSCYSIFSPVGGNCDGYVGTDGLCENSLKSYCQPKTCNNAPLTHNTDTLCKQYQTGCITNGKGCVSKLQPCSTYQGNQISCEGYIGSDGQCKGINSQIQNCVPKLCRDITVASTNAICKAQLATCVTDGVGCLDQTTCELTKKQISCQGTSGCQWNGICHSSNTCHDYLSLAVCINNTGGPNNLQCFWDDTQLVGFKCRNACQLQDFTTNLACAGINPLCRTFGTGCIDGGLPCSSYKGTRAQCENFMGLNGTIKCANLPAAVSTDVCLVRICTHNTTSTTNADCATYLTGCVTNGAGCLPNTEPCSTYKGTQAQCNLFYGQTGTYQCYNDGAATSTTACRNKLCTDISGTTVSACDTQVPGCVTDMTTCVVSTRTCSSFAGTLPQCEVLKGNDRRCTKISHFCRDKVCADVTAPALQSDCTSYLPTCRYVGSGACIDATGCASYTITGADDTAKTTLCQTLTNTTGKFCTFASGTVCAEIGTGSAECSYTAVGASDSAKVTYCATFKQATNNRICVFISGTGKCGIASVCESYTPGGADDNDNTYICQYQLNSSFQACSFVASASVCSTSTTNCSYLAYGSTTSAKYTYCTGLQGITSKCTYVEGSNNCVALGACTTYLAASGNELVSCQSVTNATPKTCSYSSGANCATPASCSDYTAQGASNYLKAIYCYALLPAGDCVYLIGSTTCTPLVTCTSYTLIATTTDDKISSCALLKNGTGSQGCTYSSGNSCVAAASCAGIKVMDLPYSSCGYPAIGVDDTSKILYCANYYSSSTLKCQFDRSGNCVVQQVCTNYSTSSGTDSDNSQLCQQLVDTTNTFCTFTNGSSTCGASSNSCAYTPHGTTFFEKMKYCSRFKYNNISNVFCTYSDLTPNTCQTLQSACTNIATSNYSSCFIYAVGATTDDYLTYCKQFLDSSGYPCRYSGGLYCMPSQAGCASYIALASTAADNQKICQDHQNTSGYNCIYSTGSTCSEPADNNCTQYISPASGQESYCTKIKYSASALCGTISQTCTYVASATTCSLSTNACAATGGTDSASCILLQNQTGSTCILDSTTCTELSVCTNYNLSGGTLASYIQSCSSVSTNSSCGKCIYSGNTTCDSPPAGCTDITLGSNASGYTIAQKQEVCQSIILNGQYCILASSTACDVSIQCQDYTAYSSEINKNSIICSKFRGGTCRYTGNAQCQDVQTNCSDYAVSGTGADLTQICQNLTNSSGYNCSYSSGSFCSNPKTNCDYTIYGSTTVEKIAYCVKLQANSSTNCSYSSLSATYCISTLLAKRFFCSTNKASNGQSCYYNSGSTCTVLTNCSDYTAVGDTQTDQINYCQTLSLSSGTSCTQASVNSACTDLQSSCSSYQVSGSTNERATLCFMLKNSSGVSCYYFSSTTCDNLTSTTCTSVKYTTQVSYYLNQSFCNTMKFSTTVFCTTLSTDNTECATPACTTTFPVGSTTSDKQIYCSLKIFSSNSCYYTSGNFCIATTISDCSSYTAAGTTVIDRQYYCNKITATSAKKCWFLGTDTSTTTCSDLTQVAKDQLTQYCQVALFSNNSCRYNQTTQLNVCASASCTTIIAQGSTDSEKYAYCFKQLKTLSCVYSTGTNCSTKQSNCASYTIYNAPTVTEKHQYCQSFVNSSGINCAYSSSGSSCYGSPSVCAYYAIGTTISDKIIYCKSLVYSTTQYCTYKTGTTCTQSKVCNQQIVLTSYSTAQRRTFCQTFINDDTLNCTYVDSNTNCTDPLPDCAYSISSTGSDSSKITECQTYKSSNGIQCTFQSGLTTCVLTTSCVRFLSSNSSQTCQANSNLSGYTCSYTSGSYCNEPLADCTYVAYTTDKTAYCSTLKDSFGNYCTYLSGANCSSRVCVSAPSSRVISDCVTFKSFCTLDTTYQCDNLECANNTTSTSDSVCGTYSLNCLTKNPGCIHRSEPCTSYPGNSTTCQNFKGTNQTILCWVGTSGNCKDRLCTDNTTATTDALCASHIPQPFGSTNPNCVKNQNAGVGCINYGTCASYQGTTTTCWNYLANDGPCKGTNGSTVAACAQRVCAEAPTSYNTHQQCIDYHPTCLSHGLGCTIKATATCDLFLSGTQCVSPLQNCTWASSCRTILPICQDYTSDGYSTCVNSYAVKSICKWSAAICTFALCEDLNASYNTHQQCQNQNKLCTTSGNGCLTISKCANYSLQACLYAYTPELGNKCAIEGVCRAIKCQDGLFSTATDCDIFLKGCVTNGKNCVTSITKCSDYLEMNICKNNQCTWVQSNTFQGQCYNYTKCQDIVSDNHQYCQLVSTSCTTDGKTCIPITLCSRYTTQISCVTGIDGKCGWQPSNQCQLFRMCSDAGGKTFKECQSFSTDCISDGVTCMDRKKCRFYSTQLSCEAGGTDSSCVWENQLQACRNTLCTDAIVNRTTIQGCSQFKAILPCTTNGEQCVTVNGTCSAYKTKEFCYKGLLGDCIWDTACRYKLCRDYQYLTTPECQTISQTCISNGVSCTPQAKCQNYLTRVACSSGGSDGDCTFNGSICKRITQCSDANLDQQTCQKYTNSCYYQNDQCLQISCSSQSFIQCKSYSNFNSTSVIYCQPINNQCTQVTGDQLNSNQCYQNSLYTYTWNQNSSKCEACYPNATLNNSSPNQTNSTNQTQIVYALMIHILLIIII